MSKTTLIDKDLGWAERMKRLKEIKDARVKVGVLGNIPAEKGGLSMAEIAAILELGTRDGKIEPRPAFQMAFERNRKALAARGKKLITAIIDGKMTVDQALGLMGADMAAKVKEEIRRGVPPPNKPSTALRKAKKGKTGRFFKAKKSKNAGKNLGNAIGQAAAIASVKPWIDTGRLLNAIAWAIDKKKE